VSVITEDWKFRMVTPKKGVYETLVLNAEGRRIGDAWDPARDEAPVISAAPTGRQHHADARPAAHHVGDDTTLKIETDAGTQTRLLPLWRGRTGGEPSWQGWSAAEWMYAVAARRRRPGGKPQGGHHQPSRRLHPQERRAVQRQGHGERSTSISTPPQRRPLADRDHEGGRPGVFHEGVSHELGLQAPRTGDGWAPSPCSAR
jgi:hypothetical protein